jgi:hypothetical protein
MSIASIIATIISDISKLIQTQLDLIRLQGAQRLIAISGVMMTVIIVGLLGMLLLLFGGMWLSYYLSYRLQMPYIGFAITTALVLFLMIILWLFRKPFIERPFREYLLAKLLKSIQP